MQSTAARLATIKLKAVRIRRFVKKARIARKFPIVPNFSFLINKNDRSESQKSDMFYR